MPIGPFIRRLFGPYETTVTDAWRSISIDIDAYVDGVRNWVPSAERILEVGCGEGAVTERLVRVYPDAEIIGIDVASNVGRLYAGPPGRARFLKTTIEEFAVTSPGTFDLVVLADVLHHVPQDLRGSILDTIKGLLVPGGSLAFKEWERRFSPIHWFGYFSDRWITGDRISYMNREEILERLIHSFGKSAIRDEDWIAPWRNNISILVRP